MIRRLFDILASFFGLLILSPVMLIVAVLIKISSRGPILFRQVRVGHHGVDFRIAKFRTMTVAPDTECGSFEPGQLCRVTRVGKVLRAKKIDELPQLWNVLRGDMSLVGPRPEVRCWVEKYPERWRIVHTVKPGITDPASVEFRNEEQILACCESPDSMYCDVILPKKLDMYEAYVHSRSLSKDLRILAQTFLTLFNLSIKSWKIKF